jgi:hypothetical protein
MESRTNRSFATADFIKSDTAQAAYLGAPHVDQLATAFLNLGAEFWTMRRRMLVLEKMLKERGVFDPDALETYEPTPDEQRDWELQRDAFIRRTFSVLTEDAGPLPTEPPDERVPPVKPGSCT